MKKMLEAFRVIDNEGKGFISKAEYKQVMSSLGYELADEEVGCDGGMGREIDIDKDDNVYYEELYTMMTSLMSL